MNPFCCATTLAVAAILVPASLAVVDYLPPSTGLTNAPSVWQDPSLHRLLFVRVEEGLQLEVLDSLAEF